MAFGNDVDLCMIHKVRLINGLCPECTPPGRVIDNGDGTMSINPDSEPQKPGSFVVMTDKEMFEQVMDVERKLNVVDMKPDQDACGENVVQRLEEALALAKGGKIDNVVIIAIGNDGCNYDAWANGQRPFEVMGALESTKLDFFNTMTDRR